MEQRNIQIQRQTQEQVQTQQLTPQQVMLVRLTEMPVEQLRQRVEQECMENPWLEREQDREEGCCEGGADTSRDEEEMDYNPQDDYTSEDDTPDYLLRTHNGSDAQESIEYGDTLSFYDQLMEQVQEYELTAHEEELVKYLIGSLEDDGLLKKPLRQLADEAEIYQNMETDEQELEKALGVLQEFDPPGVGARSLQECLLLQVRRDEANPMRDLLLKLLEKCWDDFMHNRWSRIQEKMGLNSLEVETLQHEARRLNPKPGAAMGERQDGRARQVTPDFIVETDDYGQITMQLARGNMPALVVSADATERLRKLEQVKNPTHQQMEEMQFSRQYVERGRMFITALIQRRDSMVKTMQAIIKLQRPFFVEGDRALLKPMILEDVANLTGYDISTVSRVCQSKYVQTNFGIFRLKEFFVHKSVQNDRNEDLSQAQVLEALREMVEAEDKRHPLSDEQLTQLMRRKGYNIARRTVAKYRDILGIPVARMRGV